MNKTILKSCLYIVYSSYILFAIMRFRMNHFEKGIYVQCAGYKAFVPSKINREFECNDSKIISLLEKASRYIGELNAYSKNLPNIFFFLAMMAKDEATFSNKIEGTKITLNEVVAPEEEILPERRDEKKEIINYLVSLTLSYKRLTGYEDILTSPQKVEYDTLPFCTRLIKEAHKYLLDGSRGQNKHLGEFRTTQNWIGGSMPSTAAFVPPPPECLNELLSDFENFWHNEDIYVPILIKIAISHYQFETIHPFSDGNGRIGRLILLLQLVDSGLLELPTLYLSKYFERNRKQYYDALSLVREKNDINQWIRYFLEGVCDTAKLSVKMLKNIDDLNNWCEEQIKTMRRSHVNASKLLKTLYYSPYVTSNQICDELKLDYQTANNLLKSFVKLEILTVNNKKRNKIYAFNKYLNIFNAEE